MLLKFIDCRDDEIGRRAGFKIRCPLGRVGSTPTLGTNMETNTKSYKILVTVSLFALVSLITIAMFAKVRYSTSPEGLFENYKWWIVESVEKWTKDRDNEYYSKQKVIDWYETEQDDGVVPKNNFPDLKVNKIKNIPLSKQIAESDIIVGSQSYALAVAVNAKKMVLIKA